MDQLREATDRELTTLWTQLHLATGLPVGEIGEWKLDASYIEEHGIAFLSKCLVEEEDEGGLSLADILKSAVSSGLRQ